ncbi:MAG TPA: YcgN family cysteine cluster protein [Xanthobacteraceae bacterium]|nr:YcgN family cysteine cluster protein [Xanthobacteraceae bacterium]
MKNRSEASPFWLSKPLSAMSRAEWESLCDGCGRCCLIKLEDDDTAKIHYTDVACRLLDHDTCRCRDYAGRAAAVPDCLRLTPKRAAAWKWLPESCAYRRLAEGRGLAWWHPLVSGDPETVHAASISVRGRVAREADVRVADLPSRIVAWPGDEAKSAARKKKIFRGPWKGRLERLLKFAAS